MPTQVIAIVPARVWVTFSCAPPSCMLSNTSMITLPPVACSTSFLNCWIATLEEWSGTKLPAMRSFSCAAAVPEPSANARSGAARAKRALRVMRTLLFVDAGRDLTGRAKSVPERICRPEDCDQSLEKIVSNLSSLVHHYHHAERQGRDRGAASPTAPCRGARPNIVYKTAARLYPESMATNPDAVERRRARGARAATRKAKPSVEGIHERVLNAILEHRLRPGMQLVEERLAAVFGVSRTKIRHALARLAHDGIVTVFPNRGAFVSSPTREEVHEVFEARRLIEPALVRRLVGKVTPALVRRLRDHVKQENVARKNG